MSWIYNGRKYWYHNGKKFSCKLKQKRKRIGYFYYNHFAKELRQVDYTKYLEAKMDGYRTYQRYLMDHEQELI